MARSLFNVRARIVTGSLASGDAASYVWGLLVGSDVAEALLAYRATWPDAQVRISGLAATATLFHAGVLQHGTEAAMIDADQLVVAGFMAMREAERSYAAGR